MLDPFLPLLQQKPETLWRRVHQWFDQPGSFKHRPQNHAFLPVWAEMWLFADMLGIHPQATYLPEDECLQPFGSKTPTLQALREMANFMACACFPTIGMNREGQQSHLWRLYLVKNPPVAWLSQDHRQLLTDVHSLPELQEYAIFLVSVTGEQPTTPIDGNSWQLAATMAMKALHHPEMRKELACQWVLTGKVSDDEVLPVSIGVKDDLFCSSRRKVLIPMGNKDEAVQNQNNPKLFHVNRVEQAWQIISKQGVHKPSKVNLPDGDIELHALVGESITPVLSVIFLLNPAECILWHSERTRKEAILIKEVLELFPDFSGQVSIRSLDSHDLKTAYEQLPIQERKDNRIFAITGGNRLMGIAAQIVAETFNNILVYRDVNAPKDTLTVIQFADKKFESDDINLGDRCPYKHKLNWSTEKDSGGLYAFNNFLNAQPVDVLRKIVLPDFIPQMGADR